MINSDKVFPTKNELNELYWGRKQTIEEIATAYGVSTWSIRHRIDRWGIRPRTIGEAMKLAHEKGRIGLRPKLDPTPTLAYVLGVLKGDGSVYKVKHKRTKGIGYSYVIELSVSEDGFLKSFASALKNIGLHPSVMKKGKYIKVIAWSKPFYDFYKKLTVRDIADMLKDDSMRLSFLRGFYESEGSCVFRDTVIIQMTNTDLELLNLVKELIHKLGYNCKIIPHGSNREYPWKPLWVLYMVGIREDKMEFLKRVSPCIKTLGDIPERKISPWGIRIKKECFMCGRTFWVHPYRANTAKFCSHNCHSVWKEEKPRLTKPTALAPAFP